MTSQSIHDLAAAYVINALDPEEQQLFEDHYPSCESCQQIVLDGQLAAAKLAESVSVNPSPELKLRVMEAIAEDVAPQADNQTSATVSKKVLQLAATFVVLAGLAGVGWLFASQVLPDSQSIETAQDVKTANFDGENGVLVIKWSESDSEAVLSGSDLPQLEDNQAFQLWLLKEDGSVAPAAVFVPDGGQASVSLELDEYSGTGWGVTIEPENGSEQPTSEVIFVAEF